MTDTKIKVIAKEKDRKKVEEERIKDNVTQDNDVHHLEKTAREQSTKNEQQHPQHDRCKRLSQFLVTLNIPRHHHHYHQQQQQQHSAGHSGASSNDKFQRHSPLTPYATTNLPNTTCQSTIPYCGSNNCPSICNINTSSSQSILCHLAVPNSHPSEEEYYQQYLTTTASLPRLSCVSFQSEILLLDLINGEINESVERAPHRDEHGTQRVYKKTSPNSVLTLYLPSREITLSGSSPSILRGIVFVDPKAIQGYRVYAQLTLTFRYGREDEEVMGLRFCNEAIMSLHQIWPRNEEPTKESLSPLQEALLKRLGEGAHPFTLTLTAQAPPSVQLVPAKRYYGAPIGTSYDVRCFIADKSDEKFHRRASVKMGVRVIYRTDVCSLVVTGMEHFGAVENKPISLSPVRPIEPSTNTNTASSNATNHENHSDTATKNLQEARSCAKVRQSDRGDSFPKLRLSPKTFRFSSRFGRSKSEVEKYPNDPFYNYSKSFQEIPYNNDYHNNLFGGPQGTVDKPFLLQDGRVILHARLDKSWYTHGEDVCVTINIRNESKKTVRKIRVCAIQHVDVCMFNNGKFKNVVADSDSMSLPHIDQQVAPGSSLITTVILKPRRGATRNWIALEDTLQRSTEPDEITADIAASALRTPHFLMQTNYSPNKCSSPGVLINSTAFTNAVTQATNSDERNVFAIYVSYYVKIKLTLSGIGGEVSLKLPFILVHVDEEQRLKHKKEQILLNEVPATRKNSKGSKSVEHKKEVSQLASLDRIESLNAENVHIKVTHVSSCDGDNVIESALRSEAKNEMDEDPQPSTSLALRRRRKSFMRCESIDRDVEDVTETKFADLEQIFHVAQVHSESQSKERTEEANNNVTKS